MAPTRIVNSLTHVDLAWKKSETEMAELFDLVILRILDLCQQSPNLRILLEQASLYRGLKARRPDLFARVCALVDEGRLAFATNQASSIELNVVNGESIVRDMQIGRKWLTYNLNTLSRNCAMIDTFGFPPQMPQVLRQFGHASLFATRFGAFRDRDIFRVRGLDGTEVLVAGPDIKSPYMRPGHVNMMLCREYKHFDQLFDRADANDTDVQFTLAYTENETPPMERIEARMRAANLGYRFGTLDEFMRTMEKRSAEFDVVSADLNPEFTGTFSLRHRLRLENRLTEAMLLNAEKLTALMGVADCDAEIERLWWEMGYLQFHDVITGSHPTHIYVDCLKRFGAVRASARAMIDQLLSRKPHDPKRNTLRACVWNGLCAARDATLEIALPEGWAGVDAVRLPGGSTRSFEVIGGRLILRVPLAPMSLTPIEVDRSTGHAQGKRIDLTCLDNGLMRVELGTRNMIDRIVDLKTGAVVMRARDDLMVLQGDKGCFQIEQPVDSEIAAGAGPYTIDVFGEGSTQTARIVGTFPKTQYGHVGYELTLSLRDDDEKLYIGAKVDWQARDARLRLKLSTELSATRNYYEVPFGVAERKPYETRRTARGEWPAHRFVAMEDAVSRRGIALINRGTAGVEAMDGILWTSLLRTPTYGEYINLEPDDTSSDHGVHAFEFALIAYDDGWADASIARAAQAFNDLPIVIHGSACDAQSFFECDAPNVMLSTTKRAENGLIAIRLYETTGRQTNALLRFERAGDAFESDVRELPGASTPWQDGALSLSFRPFEIKTLLVSLS